MSDCERPRLSDCSGTDLARHRGLPRRGIVRRARHHAREAADLILDGYCSTDSFWYFQAWLIGLGRDTFELVVADPDNLADVPEVRRPADRPRQDWADDEWPEWEALSYVAAGAYEEATGAEEGVYDAMAERGYADQSDLNPTGLPRDPRNPAEVARRFPRLSRMFPLHRSEP
ncbi:DUF4240 domain-containing protein [Nonomuraea terrae]|uniref:DUF4240 domain-containing protein n=1 Tax=Nonomuraea terrae TaxID=2530383 RepID=UPI0037AA4EFD